METYDSHPRKTPGAEKPARIVIETTDGTKAYDAEHHIRNNGWVSIYLGTTQDGIDVQVPRERVIEIKHGREQHTDTETGTVETAADGGLTHRDTIKGIEQNDPVHDRSAGRTCTWYVTDVEGETVRVAGVPVGADVGPAPVETERFARSNLSRCSECGDLTTYDADECDACNRGGADGE
jgi:hypothetical protein